jgi:dCTP deaminase
MVYNFRFKAGVLNKDQIKTLGQEGKIHNLREDGIDPSSFDLRLGRYFWEMRGGVKPFADERSIVDDICNKYGERNDARNPKTLEKGKTYIFPIKENINFGGTDFCGKATGKSSIGRLDVLTRVIPKNHDEYDTIKKSCSEDFFLEITPITFPIKVEEGTPMSQLRVSCCDFDKNEIKKSNPLFYTKGNTL